MVVSSAYLSLLIFLPAILIPWGRREGPMLAVKGRVTSTVCSTPFALWESLVGKTRGKATSLGPRKGNRDTAATAWEEMARSRPHSRRGLTPLWRLQKYPKIHVSTGEESSASGPDSTQGLRPQHRRERNHERPPSNTHDNWPFLRPPERVPESPS